MDPGLRRLDLGAGFTPVSGHADGQAHPTVRLPWQHRRAFERELRDRRASNSLGQKYPSADELYDPNVRVISSAALSAETARNGAHAERLIRRQFDDVIAFANAHPDRFYVPTSAADAQRELADTERRRTIFVFAIEGMHMLTDAQLASLKRDYPALWSVNPTHLRDDEFAGAAINTGMMGALLNPKGARKRRKGEDRGLTDEGKQRIERWWDMGIVPDPTHMSPQALDEFLDFTEEKGIPAFLSHYFLADFSRDKHGNPNERALTLEQALRVYANGGMVGLPVNPKAMDPKNTPRPAGFQRNTTDGIQLHYDRLRAELLRNSERVLGRKVDRWEDLTPTEMVHLQIQISSDANGTVRFPAARRDASKPKRERSEWERYGMRHAGHFGRTLDEGLDVDDYGAQAIIARWAMAEAHANARTPRR